MQYMLDTNTVSDLMKARPEVVERVKATPMAAMCMSVITEAELFYGLAKRPDAKRLHLAAQELMRRIDVLPWNSATARRYAVVRADLERQGKTLAPLDLLIAAHALEVGLTLVSRDRVFRQVDGLTVQDWSL